MRELRGPDSRIGPGGSRKTAHANANALWSKRVEPAFFRTGYSRQAWLTKGQDQQEETALTRERDTILPPRRLHTIYISSRCGSRVPRQWAVAAGVRMISHAVASHGMLLGVMGSGTRSRGAALFIRSRSHGVFSFSITTSIIICFTQVQQSTPYITRPTA